MTDAIEAGARAILDRLNEVAPAVENLSCNQHQADMDGVMVTVSRQALCYVLDAINDIAVMIVTAPPAITSGALVPASAVAEMRERCAKECDEHAREWDWNHVQTLKSYADYCAASIRQLDLSHASGEYVVVPREPTQAMMEAGWDAANQDIGGDAIGTIEIQSVIGRTVWTAMLAAATRTGGGE